MDASLRHAGPQLIVEDRKRNFNVVAITMDGAIVIPASPNKFYAFKTSGPATHQELDGRTTVMSIAVSTINPNQFATGSHDGSVRFWDLSKFNKPTHRVIGKHESPITVVTLSFDDRLVAAGDRTSSISIWDATRQDSNGNKTKLRCLTADMEEVSALAFTPDGKYLVSSV